MDHAELESLEATISGVTKRLTEVSQDIVEILPLAEAASRFEQDTAVAIGSGFSDIDVCLDGGFREGDFTVVSGVPGNGKTTLCRMFTINLAKAGVPSMWFSHEMTVRELWDSFNKMGADPSLLSYVPMSLDQDLAWTLAHVEKAIAQYNIKAVFIDTIGDIVKSVKNQRDLSNNATYIHQICKDLRNFAIQKNIMVFVVAHATKNTKSKTDETENSDIAYSNGIPAVAANIFHVWRDPNEADLTMIKIGKSRRNGTAHGRRYKFRFNGGRLVPEGRYEIPNEDVWNMK